MANETWVKTTSGNVLDTLGNIVGTGDGAGTITLTASPIVSNGNTLRIEEGVTIKMDGATRQFSVERNGTGSGTLRIVGTELEPVLMTSNAGSPAPGDYRYIELVNGVEASNPSVIADWFIMEYSQSGITGGLAGASQPMTVTLNNCTFRRIQTAHLQVVQAQRVGANGLWSATNCVFDKCPADELAGATANVISVGGRVLAGAGIIMRMEIDHCSILCNVDVATNDREIFTAGPRAELDVRNSIAVGTNIDIVRETRTAIVLAPGGVLTNDWNWTFTDGPDDWVDGANDESQDPNYFNDSCIGNSDLRPDFDTGVLTADEFGGLLGALQPYNLPDAPPPPPPDEPEVCEGDDYNQFITSSCIPVVCDYDFFTGEYPEDWRVELYDKKNTSAHQLVVCITLPNKGIATDFVFAPGVPIELIAINDETVTVNLGKWVQSMRPIKAERDITFKEYQGSDIDLVFMDWFGRLDPHIAGSLFHNLKWVGLRVEIGSWICGTEQVLKHGRFFLEDITRRSESTVIRLKDWFLETLSQPLRANHSGYLTIRARHPDAGMVPELVQVDNTIAIVEKVKLVFVDEGREDSRLFDWVGSVTGLQGRGSLDAPFTTDDLSATIPLAAWAGFTGIFTPGDEVGFTLSNVAFGNPVQVIYDYLTSYGDLVEGTDILLTEFLEALELLPTMANIRLRHGSPVTLLEACRIAARHGFLTLSTNAEGRVVLGGFKPRLAQDLTAIENNCITSANDLKELQTENIEVLNLIRSSYNPVESDGLTHSGLVGGAASRWLTYPTEDLGADFNRSAIFYGSADDPKYFPFDVDLPGFRAGQEAAIFAILQNHWIFFEGTPTAREKFTITTKLHNLNRDLEDIVYIESRRPNRTAWGQVIGFAKAPLSHEVELTVVDISDIVQPDFACGYAFCDSNHYTDDCWVCW